MTIDRFIDDEFRVAAKYSNREVLDESGAYALHGAAAGVYARGYQDGRLAERQRANGERQRERDRARAERESESDA